MLFWVSPVEGEKNSVVLFGAITVDQGSDGHYFRLCRLFYL